MADDFKLPPKHTYDAVTMLIDSFCIETLEDSRYVTDGLMKAAAVVMARHLAAHIMDHNCQIIKDEIDAMIGAIRANIGIALAKLAEEHNFVDPFKVSSVNQALVDEVLKGEHHE